MKKGKKTVIIVVLCALALFLAGNLFWGVWREARYGAYGKGMKKNDVSTVIVPRYYYTDSEGYDYSAKYPDYLSFTGNMTVGLPATPEEFFTDFMVIWPKPFGGYKYGVSLTVDEENYQIYINPDGTAVDPVYNEIIEQNQDTVNDLLNKADQMWHLQG